MEDDLADQLMDMSEIEIKEKLNYLHEEVERARGGDTDKTRLMRQVLTIYREVVETLLSLRIKRWIDIEDKNELIVRLEKIIRMKDEIIENQKEIIKVLKSEIG